MPKHHTYYRNIRARDLFDLFMVAAATSVLLVRFYLHVTGYPQIGSDSLHIAHMLWGGLLMLAALAIGLAFLGRYAQTVTALVGGVGFGVFIDELGKFITHDNDYFYRPAIGLIYAVFVMLYMIFSFLSRGETLSSREYQLNAIVSLEDAVARDLDRHEKQRIRRLLNKADTKDPLTKELKQLLSRLDTIPPPSPGRLGRLSRRYTERVDTMYAWFRQGRNSARVISLFFGLEFCLFLISLSGTVYYSISGLVALVSRDIEYLRTFLIGQSFVVGQFLCSAAAIILTIYGLALLTRSRLRAYEQFRRAALINLFLTNFFLFALVQFKALPSFFLNLVILGLVTYAMSQERRLKQAA